MRITITFSKPNYERFTVDLEEVNPYQTLCDLLISINNRVNDSEEYQHRFKREWNKYVFDTKHLSQHDLDSELHYLFNGDGEKSLEVSIDMDDQLKNTIHNLSFNNIVAHSQALIEARTRVSNLPTYFSIYSARKNQYKQSVHNKLLEAGFPEVTSQIISEYANPTSDRYIVLQLSTRIDKSLHPYNEKYAEHNVYCALEKLFLYTKNIIKVQKNNYGHIRVSLNIPDDLSSKDISFRWFEDFTSANSFCR
jgi:hypothetical protein